MESVAVPAELAEMSPSMLKEWVQGLGEPAYRGSQIFQWIHRKNVSSVDEMNNLSKSFRTRLSSAANLSVPLVLRQQISRDGTRKFLLQMQDQSLVETVLIPQSLKKSPRYSICISTQVGCPVRCLFCATGNSGFYRNLKTYEIVGEVLSSKRALQEGLQTPDTEKLISNIVYMGMGEPFLNYEATLRSLRLFNEHEGLDIGQRRITVSTSGVVDGIQRLIQENLQVTLAVSLHACNNALRDRLVPMNRKYPLETLREALNLYYEKTGRRITLEYILLENCNMRQRDAKDLAEWMKPFDANVNLIPYNPVWGLPFRKPPREKVMEFMKYLEEQNVNVALRSEHGPDIQAACGQLAVQKG